MPFGKDFFRGVAERARIMDFQCVKVEISVADNRLWLPVYTQPLHEFRLYKYFQERSIASYLPVLPEVKSRAVKNGKAVYKYQRKEWRPMFRSYVFAQLTREEKKAAWRSRSVIQFLDVPAERQNDFVNELRSVQLIEELGRTAPVEFRPDIQVNDRFVIESGSFEGVCGWLVQRKKQFLWVVKIECFGTFVLTEIDPAMFKMSKLEV